MVSLRVLVGSFAWVVASTDSLHLLQTHAQVQVHAHGKAECKAAKAERKTSRAALKAARAAMKAAREANMAAKGKVATECPDVQLPGDSVCATDASLATVLLGVKVFDGDTPIPCDKGYLADSRATDSNLKAVNRIEVVREKGETLSSCLDAMKNHPEVQRVCDDPDKKCILTYEYTNGYPHCWVAYAADNVPSAGVYYRYWGAPHCEYTCLLHKEDVKSVPHFPSQKEAEGAAGSLA